MVATLQTSPCNLCPFLCGADRDNGQLGRCKAGREMIVARAALHYWEEPVISGARGSGAVFFARCPIGCIYCQNAEIADADIGYKQSVDDLARVFLSLQDQGALNINCVTPTHHSLDIAKAVARSRENGLVVPVIWNTSGYERIEAIERLCGTVDIYLTDYKYADSSLSWSYSRVWDYPIVALDAIKAMVQCAGAPKFDTVGGRQRMTGGVIIRHMMLPGALEASKKAVRMLFSEFGDGVLYSIMNQYTPVLSSRAECGDAAAEDALSAHPELAERVPDEEYDMLLDYADSIGLDGYFWQEGSAAEESFVPIWDGTGLLNKE